MDIREEIEDGKKLAGRYDHIRSVLAHLAVGKERVFCNLDALWCVLDDILDNIFNIVGTWALLEEKMKVINYDTDTNVIECELTKEEKRRLDKILIEKVKIGEKLELKLRWK